MDDVLLLTGYGEVLSFQTVRQTYKEDEFRIDIDEACYSDGHTYRLAEIELLAETPDAAEHAVRAIVEFAQKKKLTFKPVHGKLLHYLSFKNPDVYNQILQSAFPDARRDIK